MRDPIANLALANIEREPRQSSAQVKEHGTVLVMRRWERQRDEQARSAAERLRAAFERL